MGLTMQKPLFNGTARHPDARWSSEEIRSWLRYMKANSSLVPWRLQWIDAAEEMLSARATAGTNG